MDDISQLQKYYNYYDYYTIGVRTKGGRGHSPQGNFKIVWNTLSPIASPFLSPMHFTITVNAIKAQVTGPGAHALQLTLSYRDEVILYTKVTYCQNHIIVNKNKHLKCYFMAAFTIKIISFIFNLNYDVRSLG